MLGIPPLRNILKWELWKNSNGYGIKDFLQKINGKLLAFKIQKDASTKSHPSHEPSNKMTRYKVSAQAYFIYTKYGGWNKVTDVDQMSSSIICPWLLK